MSNIQSEWVNEDEYLLEIQKETKAKHDEVHALLNSLKADRLFIQQCQKEVKNVFKHIEETKQRIDQLIPDEEPTNKM